MTAVASSTHDLVVVGSGIVGLAVAREWITRRPADSVVVLERSAFTGGTTAAPKAVSMTHGSLSAYLSQIEACVNGVGFERFLADTPQQLLYAVRLGKSAHAVGGRFHLPLKHERRHGEETPPDDPRGRSMSLR